MPVDERYLRTEAVLGAEALKCLRDMRVAVFGLGGVGGWCAEALARTGVGELWLVDSDVVAVSNLNRQLAATVDTVGRPKTEALAARLKAVAPDVRLKLRTERYTPETAATFPLEEVDCVIDAIDSLDCKAALIRHALSVPSVTLFSSMGAARRTDFSRILTTPFRQVTGDGLARALRNRFRRSGGIPARDFTCVWSDEPPTVCGGEPGAMGSLVHITAAFGLALAGLVVNEVLSPV